MSTRIKIDRKGLRAATEAMACFTSYDTPNTLAEDCIRAYLEASLSTEPREAEGWRSMDTAPKDQEVLIAYWRWRNSMSPGSIVVQSASLTEHHGKGIWSWVVSDNKHGPFPIRGWCDGDLLGWQPLPAAPLPEDTHHG